MTVSAVDTVSRLESSQDVPVHSAATSHATVSSHRELLLQTRLKRKSDNIQNETRARAKTGRRGFNGVASQEVSCYS